MRVTINGFCQSRLPSADCTGGRPRRLSSGISIKLLLALVLTVFLAAHCFTRVSGPGFGLTRSDDAAYSKRSIGRALLKTRPLNGSFFTGRGAYLLNGRFFCAVCGLSVFSSLDLALRGERFPVSSPSGSLLGHAGRVYSLLQPSA
ncbi:hypothetical protein NDU88_004519 [Pleurodeles waltl]|uniref:Uncharacterized protein n=1 Tax=Pleurodeles waltl TaxID=8319 RepID=A0AAV7VHB4_PLEWA|nr:hypothetical protein NDU88_004519 [Pleurodeles waltl]